MRKWLTRTQKPEQIIEEEEEDISSLCHYQQKKRKKEKRDFMQSQLGPVPDLHHSKEERGKEIRGKRAFF